MQAVEVGSRIYILGILFGNIMGTLRDRALLKKWIMVVGLEGL